MVPMEASHGMPRTQPGRSGGEDRIVRLIQKRFARSAPFLKRGIGDDAAVFRPRGADELWAVTTDLLLEDIDFRPGWMTPAQLGHKALAVNLSDLAAMGVRPRCYTVALGLPGQPERGWIDKFYRGLCGLGEVHGAVLIGGDLSNSSHGLHISVTAFGETLDNKLLYRSGGSPGDSLFVTGVLGRAAAGLRLLSLGKLRGTSAPERLALKAQRAPEPRCATGLWLARSGLASCMMDLSDGLSCDLPRLCAACGTGAEIYSRQLPVFRDSASWGCDPAGLALHGGEDVELLFGVPEKKLKAFRKSYPAGHPPATLIGILTRSPRLVCRSGPGTPPVALPPLGFDHFRSPTHALGT